MKLVKEIGVLIGLIYIISAFIAFSFNPHKWGYILRTIDVIVLIAVMAADKYLIIKKDV